MTVSCLSLFPERLVGISTDSDILLMVMGGFLDGWR